MTSPVFSSRYRAMWSSASMGSKVAVLVQYRNDICRSPFSNRFNNRSLLNSCRKSLRPSSGMVNAHASTRLCKLEFSGKPNCSFRLYFFPLTTWYMEPRTILFVRLITQYPSAIANTDSSKKRLLIISWLMFIYLPVNSLIQIISLSKYIRQQRVFTL